MKLLPMLFYQSQINMHLKKRKKNLPKPVPYMNKTLKQAIYKKKNTFY